jgi:glucose-6-phosphate isomerase
MNYFDIDSSFRLKLDGFSKFTDRLATIREKFKKVNAEMLRIESGEIKNPDENRQVSHFTDRIEYPKSELFAQVEEFSKNIRDGVITSPAGGLYKNLVVNGIGGSALGPQLLQFALNGPYWNELSREQRKGGLRIYFTDNTDSSGYHDIIQVADLAETLILSISKSGGTRETYNNMVAFESAYSAVGLEFANYAVAITMDGSKLAEKASADGWLKVFSMADSIGGRTSETSIVGHLPAALTGIEFSEFLAGACCMDVQTRNQEVEQNPAYLLASVWYIAGDGAGNRNMVIVPYSDRLVLLSRYLQQLVMESLGKEFDLDGNVVHQGLNVFGNKGGTDAHAFIQQLNDGRNDFFVTFIETAIESEIVPVDSDFTMNDYLHAFRAGLSQALQGKGRDVIEMFIPEVNSYYLGMLIALYERAVAAYAELINVNAFHQPGVQSYKLASGAVSESMLKIFNYIEANHGFSGSAKTVAAALAMDVDEVEIMLERQARNGRFGVTMDVVDNKLLFNFE